MPEAPNCKEAGLSLEPSLKGTHPGGLNPAKPVPDLSFINEKTSQIHGPPSRQAALALKIVSPGGCDKLLLSHQTVEYTTCPTTLIGPR